MQFSRKFLISSAIVLVLALAFWQLSGNEAMPDDTAEQEAAAEATDNDDSRVSKSMRSLNQNVGGKETPIPVEAAPAKRGSLVQKVSAQGRVFSYQKANIISEVSGQITALHIRDGQVVKKGELIAEIDETEYKLDVEEAERNFLVAKADYVTFDVNVPSSDAAQKASDPKQQLADLEKQLEDGLISKQDYERQKLVLELRDLREGNRQGAVLSAKLLDQARINLEKARLRHSKCKIYAPFDGTIFDLKVSMGEFLSANAEIAQLTNMDDLVVKAKVLESEIGEVYKGRPAVITFPALPRVGNVEGTIQAISPIVNEEDKTVETIVHIDRKIENVRPGMFSEVSIDARIYEDLLMVPKTAILPRDNRKVIFKVGEDNRAKWIYVQTGVENDEYVEITEGELQPGEMVLTNNHFTMGHDTLVKISVPKNAGNSQ